MPNDHALLHIGGIVATSTMLKHGNVYAVIEDDGAFASSLIAATLRDACAGNHPACLITTAARVDSILGQDAHRASLMRAIDAADITVLLRTAAPSGPAQGARRATALIEEIAFFGARRRALIVVDEADDVLAGAQAERAAQLRDWRSCAENGDNIVLLVLRCSARPGCEPVAALLAHMQLLAGLVRIRTTCASTMWEIFHWFHAGGVTAGASLLLQRHSGGALLLSEPPARHNEPTLAADEEAVFATRDVLLPLEKPMPHWQMVDTQDRMAAQALGAQAATFLIEFSRTSTYEQVARCIFALRKSAGPRLKIVVREINMRMRQSQETLALRLGANLVIPAGVHYARFVGMVAMVQGQVFAHTLANSYEQAYAELMPQQEQGYFAPVDFYRAVAACLQRSASQRLQCALIELPLAPGLTPIDVLRFCQIDRHGDLLTADLTRVFLFLPACREGDISLTLERLFRLPIGDLFCSERRYLSLPDMRAAIDEFASGSALLPDLTAALAALAREASGTPMPMPASSGSSGGNAPGLTRYSPPTPAIRRARPLRAGQFTGEII